VKRCDETGTTALLMVSARLVCVRLIGALGRDRRLARQKDPMVAEAQGESVLEERGRMATLVAVQDIPMTSLYNTVDLLLLFVVVAKFLALPTTKVSGMSYRWISTASKAAADR
jgi:hypothetical protein